MQWNRYPEYLVESWDLQWSPEECKQSRTTLYLNSDRKELSSPSHCAENKDRADSTEDLVEMLDCPYHGDAPHHAQDWVVHGKG